MSRVAIHHVTLGRGRRFARGEGVSVERAASGASHAERGTEDGPARQPLAGAVFLRYNVASADRRMNLSGCGTVGVLAMGRTKPARSGDTKVVRAAIHPAIGIARVGNSEKGFFIGPEVTDPLPVKPGFAKDSTGAQRAKRPGFASTVSTPRARPSWS